jgi:hypothetical protein
MQELLQQNIKTLDIARLGLDDMVPSYPAYAAKDLDSTASGIDSGDSMLGDRESVVSNTRFIFDGICFDSKPYRHTVARVSAKKRNHHKRWDPAASSGPPPLPAARETEAEPDTAMLRETPTPVHLVSVPAEEHEAVLMKLREAEALIRTLQGRTQQPGTVSSDNPTVADPSQHPPRVKDRVNEPLQSIATQTIEVKSPRQPHTDDGLPVAPTANNSHRRATRPVENACDFLPVRNVVQKTPKITTQPDRKASNTINEPSTLSNESPMAARPTRCPDRSKPKPSQREIKRLTDCFKKEPESSIKVHFTPRENGQPQQIIITNLHNGTTQILDADTGRKVRSTSASDTQSENAPTATGHTVDAATFLDPSRPLLAASSVEARSLPDVIPTAPWCSSPESPEARLGQVRTRSAVARTTNPVYGYGTSGLTNSQYKTRKKSTGIVHNANDLATLLWPTPGHAHGSQTIAVQKQSRSTDSKGVNAYVLRDPDVLQLQQAPLKPGAVDYHARQMTPNAKEEAHEVFQSELPLARPNPSPALPIDNGFQGSDISRTKQIKERAATIPRPHHGYSSSLPDIDVDRLFGIIMETTAHDVPVLSMPTGRGAQVHPQSLNPLEATLAKDVEKAKKQSVFIRAFRGLKKPGNELATVEEILEKLLIEVKALQTDMQQDK